MRNIKKMVLVSAFAGTCLAPYAQTTSPAIQLIRLLKLTYGNGFRK